MKRELLNRIRITARGFGILRGYCPGLTRGKAVSALIEALRPFSTIWLSASIINELTGARRISALAIYAGCIVVINFVAAILKNLVDRVCEQRESLMWNWFGKIFADKQMSLDFPDLEDPAIRQQKKQAEEDLFMFGNGLAQLVWGTAGLVRASINIVLSVSLTVTLFTSNSSSGFIDSPLWIPALLALTLLGAWCHSRGTIKENKVFEEWCKQTVWYNRVFMFFGRELYMNPERAKDLRIYAQHAVASKSLDSLLSSEKDDKKYVSAMARYPALAELAVGVANLACYLFVALKAFFGAFAVGGIVQYVGALAKLSEGLCELMFIESDNFVYCSHLKSLYEFLDLPSRADVGGEGVNAEKDGCRIAFENVSFRYPGAEKPALRNVTLSVEPGKKLAVVGMNGSGKSTLIKLLCRLYEPDEGAILFKNIDINRYSYAEYMSVLSVVPQDFRLFSFKIGQNVGARYAYDAAKAEACLAAAGFGERLKTLPEGMETPLYKDFDERGVEISGGEAQKIALARALYKDAPVIVLDEPTAALDPVAEGEIYAKFNEIIGDKTAIYISHRLSSCKFCDEIAVLDEGRLIQRGTHEELLSDTSGKYYELWRAQAQYYENKAV